MASVRRSLPAEPHPLFRGVFDDWHTKAGALSALPDAPVVTDVPNVLQRLGRTLQIFRQK